VTQTQVDTLLLESAQESNNETDLLLDPKSKQYTFKNILKCGLGFLSRKVDVFKKLICRLNFMVKY